MINKFKKANTLSLIIAGMIFVAMAHTAANANNNQVYVGASYGIGMVNAFGDIYMYDGEYLPTVQLKNVQNFGIELGYRLNNNVRIGLACKRFYNLNYENFPRSNEQVFLNQKIRSNALFANFYFDLNKFEKLKPYINIGLGASKNMPGDVFLSGDVSPLARSTLTAIEGSSNNKFAWNAGMGIAYKVNDRFTIDIINYTYYDLGRAEIWVDNDDIPVSGRLRISSLNIGIRVYF